MMFVEQGFVSYSRFRLRTAGVRAIPWLWGFALAVILTGGMFRADFSIIDDHYEALWLGGGPFRFAEIWPALPHTEVGSPDP